MQGGLHRDRARPEHEALPRLARPRRGGLPGDEAGIDAKRTSRACSPPATCRTTSTARRSLPPARAVWRHWTPSGSSPPSRGIRTRRSLRRAKRKSQPGSALDSPHGDVGRPARSEPSRAPRRAPAPIHESALDAAERPAQHEDEPRPRLEGQGEYVFGILLVAVAVPEEDRIYYQEIDLVLTKDKAVTVRKTPENGEPFRHRTCRAVVRASDRPGMIAYRIMDEVIEDYLDLIDTITRRSRRSMTTSRTGHRSRSPADPDLRHDMLHVRRTLSPTRDAIRKSSTTGSTSRKAGASRESRDRIRQRRTTRPPCERRARLRPRPAQQRAGLLHSQDRATTRTR